MRKKRKSVSRGRPAFKPSRTQKVLVAAGAMRGESHDSIAAALKISRNTLETYFAEELQHAGALRRMKTADALYKAAMAGNVTAMKAILASPEPRWSMPVAPAGPAVEPEGKKARANADAKTAQVGTGWDGLLPSGKPSIQ